MNTLKLVLNPAEGQLHGDGEDLVAVFPGPLIISLEGREVDSEIKAQELGNSTVRDLPSGELLHRLDTAGGALG